MERNSQASQGYRLESQIREAYGRIIYTLTCHNKIINRLKRKNDLIKIAQIILSALLSGSFLVTIISSDKASGSVGGILSVILLILNTYAKNFNLIESVQEHQKASDLLWKIREEYVSLLTDFEVLEMEDIIKKRDELQDRTSEVYSNSPRTDAKSYAQAGSVTLTV
ncbi:SLATT domain-containing protein [Piscibacillus halophilus]|uniref:SMODS and SLOG-associating 2TM effector domain-containing protein n=1 Tax=Piscibacillus halophilus TaxID=571933 RepID=A0A1H9G3Q5_9BACI|nr:SLATT domain-containing protein [Piscibacillus halophilus]SEQ44796.1 hypothetical protein SAMN05216362_11418 [Piscibacillus halophilus]